MATLLQYDTPVARTDGSATLSAKASLGIGPAGADGADGDPGPTGDVTPEAIAARDTAVAAATTSAAGATSASASAALAALITGLTGEDAAVAFLVENDSATRDALGETVGRGASVKQFGATGDGTTDDTAAIQAAIDATPAGGMLWIPRGEYVLTDTLTVPEGITIRGEGCTAAFTNTTGGGFPQYPADPPYLIGSVLKMTTAATDAVALSGSGKGYDLSDFGIVFADGLASTGHGINGTPTVTQLDGLDYGPTDAKIRNVSVFGHDGDHYGFVLTNFQYVELFGPRTYGGGGFLFVGNGSLENWGNLVAVNPYVMLNKVGTAHGFAFDSDKNWPLGGTLNLMLFLRPQCNILGDALTAGTQHTWKEDLGGLNGPMTVVACDFEGGSPYASGPHTSWIGNTFGLNTDWLAVGDGTPGQKLGRTGIAVGGHALNALTTGSHNLAVGVSAMNTLTTGSDNTAVGDTAMYAAASTAEANTAIGRSALYNVTSGHTNVAVGKDTVHTLTTASNVVAVGANALYSLDGDDVVAVGASAGYWQTGSANVFLGTSAAAGASGSNGWHNTAVGYHALLGGTSGSANVAVGSNAGGNATSAEYNVFVGYGTGLSTSTQRNHVTVVGAEAVANGADSTAIGAGTSAGAAGAVAIGRDSSGTGAAASAANEFVLGTSNHRYKMPGLPTSNPGVGTGILWNNGGVVTVA